jgi:cytochrome bd ubiquinol oxidase subunit II
MTVVVVILPLVLAYQTWTYYVFRRRVSRQEFRPPRSRAGAGTPACPAASLPRPKSVLDGPAQAQT